MSRFFRYLFIAGLLFSVISQHSIAAGPAIKSAVDSINANVIFMRHALAPGFGDPDDFVLGHCETQRNLNQSGIKQAQALGQDLKDSNLSIVSIYSSQWCRCLDTAIHLDLIEVVPFAGLNSFYEGHVDRDATLQMLKTKLDSLSHQGVVVMVTHQVVISAITGVNMTSGGMIAYNTTTAKVRAIEP